MLVDASKAKYPYTKELVRHAREKGGLKQTKIAKMCGVQQSVVSNWCTGPKKATLEQIKPLVEMFGDVVKKVETQVYLVCEHKGFEINDAVFKTLAEFISKARIEHGKAVQERKDFGELLPDYRQPKKISDPKIRKKFEYEIGRYETALARYEAVRVKLIETNLEREIKALHRVMFELVPMEGRLFTNQDEFLELFSQLPTGYLLKSSLSYKMLRNDLLTAAHKYDSQTVQIEGEVIFRYVFEIDKDDPGPIWNRNDEKIPWMKWVVHDLGGGKFCWLVQQPKKTYFPVDTQRQPDEIWLSTIEKPDDIEGILASARNYPLSSRQKSAVDLESLIFLITKAFLDRGYDVKGVTLIQKKTDK